MDEIPEAVKRLVNVTYETLSTIFAVLDLPQMDDEGMLDRVIVAVRANELLLADREMDDLPRRLLVQAIKLWYTATITCDALPAIEEPPIRELAVEGVTETLMMCGALLVIVGRSLGIEQ